MDRFATRSDRWLVGLVALIVGAHLGAPLGAQAIAVRQEAIIDVWTHAAENSTELRVIEAAAQAFNLSQANHRVEVFPSIGRYYEDRVRSAAATGSLPCLLEIDGPFVYVFAWPGYLQPLDRFVPPELLQDLLPSIVAQGTYDGRLYSLGQFDSGLGLWGNRRYLDAAGVRLPSVESPWDLAEFEAAMEKLNAVPGVEYALSLNTYVGPSEFFAYAYSPIVQGFGGDLIDRRQYRSAKGVLDGPESVLAMRHVQHWFAKRWSQDVRDRVDDFERGRAALSWTGHWKYPDFHAALGDDLVLMPLPDLGHGIKTGIGSWSWGITSTCSNSAGAWAFLEFLLSSDEILRMTNANGAVPARYSALARSPLYSEGGPLRLFAQQLTAGLGVPRPATPGYSTISRAFAQAVSAIINGGDIQFELTKAARIIDADIARHRGYPRR